MSKVRVVALVVWLAVFGYAVFHEVTDGEWPTGLARTLQAVLLITMALAAFAEWRARRARLTAEVSDTPT